MKPVTWLLEKEIFLDEETKLKEAIMAEGHQFVEFDAAKRHWDIEFAGDRPCVFRGSLNTARYIQEMTTFDYSVICNFSNFKCLNYYPKYTHFLLNYPNHIILPLSEAIRLNFHLFHDFIRSNRVFVRPNSGRKEFSGRVLTYENFNWKNLDFDIYYNDPNLLILIAPYEQITREYRFIIHNTTIATECLQENVPTDVLRFTQGVLDEVQWKPDEVYTLDVASILDTYAERNRVVEINSASCSGFYKGDYNKIVRAMSAAAVNEYRYAIGD